jgi:hypothetical protein
MQTLTWSSDLHSTVKKIKFIQAQNPKKPLTDKDFMSSLTLSEEKVMISSFKTVNNISPDGIWG